MSSERKVSLTFGECRLWTPDSRLYPQFGLPWQVYATTAVSVPTVDWIVKLEVVATALILPARVPPPVQAAGQAGVLFHAGTKLIAVHAPAVIVQIPALAEFAAALFKWP